MKSEAYKLYGIKVILIILSYIISQLVRFLRCSVVICRKCIKL